MHVGGEHAPAPSKRTGLPLREQAWLSLTSHACSGFRTRLGGSHLTGPGPYTQRVRRVVVILVAVLVACSSTERPIQSTDGPTTTVVSASTTSAVTTTTSAAAPASTATIGVGGEVLDLVALCYSPGASDLVVVAEGESASAETVSVLVQAVLGEPYVSVRIADRLLESTLNEPLVLTIDDGVIRGERITFVENLDLETGVGEPAGLGFVRVECRGFEAGLPDAYG